MPSHLLPRSSVKVQGHITKISFFSSKSESVTGKTTDGALQAEMAAGGCKADPAKNSQSSINVLKVFGVTAF